MLWASPTDQQNGLVPSGALVLQPFEFPADLSSGEDVTFRCVVKKGEPPYTFRWLKNDLELRGQDRVTLVTVSERLATMTIRRIVPDDSANYSCVVSDGASTSSIAATLIVTGELPLFSRYHLPDK